MRAPVPLAISGKQCVQQASSGQLGGAACDAVHGVELTAETLAENTRWALLVTPSTAARLAAPWGLAGCRSAHVQDLVSLMQVELYLGQ